MNKLTVLFFLAFFALENTVAQSVSLAPFSSGYNWLIGFKSAPTPLGDGNVLYVFQKDGFIRLCLPDGSVEPTPFLDLSAQVNNSFNNEMGLLGVAFHPDYQANGYFYVFYNQIGTGDCTVSRFERSSTNPSIADPASETVLLTWPHPLANHVGGCIQFGPDGYLYIASGDGGGAGDPDGNGQNLGTFLGKLLRIDVDNGDTYAVPADNPFVDEPGALPEIFASGLRNPWRFSFDRVTGDLWIGDVGQDEREEIDFVPAGSGGGQNFGWSCREGTLPFNADECPAGVALTEPIYDYENSLQSGNCSVTGGVVYRGSQYADLFGKYIFTDFCSGRIWALTKDGDEVESVVEMGDFTNNNFTVLNDAPNGELFVAGFFSNDIMQIKSDDCTPVAWIPGPASISLDGGAVTLEVYRTDLGFDYQWLKDGVEIPGATDATLTISEPGIYTVSVYSFSTDCSNVSNEIEITPATGIVSISGQLEACVASSHYYDSEVFAGANYEWTVEGGTLLEGDAPQSFVLWGNEGVGHLSLTVTLADGTVLTGEIEVEISPNNLSLEAEFSEAVCAGENNGYIDLTPVGSGTIFEYFWNTNDTSEDLFNLSPDAYKVTVTNELGCFAIDAFILYEVPPVEVFWEILPETCGHLGAISGVVVSPVCDTSLIFPNMPQPAGVYPLTVTDCFGCEDIFEVEIPDDTDIVLINAVVIAPSPGMSDGSISIQPTGGVEPYSFEWDNGSTDNPLADLPEGEYTVTVTDANGCETTATFSTFGVNSANEKFSNENFELFPNPTDGVFTLQTHLPKAEKMTVTLLDPTGKNLGELVSGKNFGAGDVSLTFDLSGRPSGIYFLEIKMGEEIFGSQIIKK